MYKVLPEAPETWERMAAAVKRGGLVVFPTDTVYGIGCDPYNTAALEMIYVAKGRPEQKAIPLLLAQPLDVAKVADALSDVARALAERLWPGALTLVVPKAPRLPAPLGSGGTIAVRVPDHDALRRMIGRCGGSIAATSANISGRPDALTVSDAVEYLGDSVDIYVDGGPSPGQRPSTVVDCTVTPPRILREGAIRAAEIEKVVGAVAR